MSFIIVSMMAVLLMVVPSVDAQQVKPATKKVAYSASVPAPYLTDVKYGDHGRNVMDFWKAKSDKPTPLVIVIHGGGWNGGSKELIHRFVKTNDLLDAGISVAAINYRLIKHGKNLQPPVQAPLHDAARAVQFIRSKAEEWNVDSKRIAAAGGSAGACSSLWLAYHDDLADPKSDDPIARESTRLMCVAVSRPQTTLDPRQMKKWIPNSKYGAHAFGKKGFAEYLADRDKILPWINEYSPYALLSKDDPPTHMRFSQAPAKNGKEKDPTHSPIFGLKLQERCKELGVPCEVASPGAAGMKYSDSTSYLIAKLKSAP